MDELCVNLGKQGSFFMPKYRHKELMTMFSDEILERIFADKEIQKIPVGAQSTVIEVVSRILEEMGVDVNATLRKS